MFYDDDCSDWASLSLTMPDNADNVGTVSSPLITQPTAVAGPAYQARHNLTPADFQAMFNQLGAQGFRLVDVSGYEDGAERLAGIWAQTGGPPYQARTGLTGADFQSTSDQLGKQSYRLVRLNGYQVSDSARFAAIWVQTGGPAYQVRFGLTGDAFQSTVDQLAKQGYRLVDVSGYRDGGNVRFTAIWEQRTGPAYQVRFGLTVDDLAAFGNQFGPQGYRLVRISGYQDGNDARYVVIWEQKDGPSWAWYFGQSAADYQATFDRQLSLGYRLAEVSAYTVGGQSRFASIWTQ